MISSTDIQNTLQRAFAKAIAMHGIGLYVYRGEDFPEETGHDVKKVEKEIHSCEKCGTEKIWSENKSKWYCKPCVTAYLATKQK